jgi:hypothetical protein
MSKIMSSLLTACAWAILLGVVVAAITRVSIEAKERRNERSSPIEDIRRTSIIGAPSEPKMTAASSLRSLSRSALASALAAARACGSRYHQRQKTARRRSLYSRFGLLRWRARLPDCVADTP